MPSTFAVPWKTNKRVEIQERYQKDFGRRDVYKEDSNKTKKFRKTLLLVVFLLSTATFISLLFIKPPLPGKDKILDKVINQEPFQNQEVIREQLLTKGDFRYKIYPQYSYELYGLVVSEYNSENVLDVMHKNDPAQIKDLCVVWGDNIVSGIYKDLKYKSGEFTCFAQPKEGKSWDLFSGEHLSNNHLVPADDLVADKIRKANVGDQIYIKGYLSRYEVYDKSGNLISTRGTSVIREDKLCETIYTTEFEILKGNNYLFKVVRSIAGVIAVFSFISLAIVILFL
jgi:hypothetical protein